MNPPWTRRHLLDLQSLSRDEILTILDAAREFKGVGEREIKKVPALRGKTVVNLFVENSTRTRISFELAALRLSADVIDCVEPINEQTSQPRTRPSSANIDVMGSPRNVAPMRVYGTHMPRAVTKLTCRRCSHAGIMSPLEPPPGGSDVCFIYS